METVIIYTDGSCSPNPGNGGWGAILIHGAKRKEISGNAKETTNNRMELTAAIEGLKCLNSECKVLLTSDSRYVVNGINSWARKWQRKNWTTSQKKPVLNIDLWQEVLALMATHTVMAVWVRGHNGDVENERADVLATTAMLGADTNIEVLYERR